MRQLEVDRHHFMRGSMESSDIEAIAKRSAEIVIEALKKEFSFNQGEYILVDDVVKQYGVCKRTVYRKIKDQKIQADFTMGRYRIKKTDFELAKLRGIL